MRPNQKFVKTLRTIYRSLQSNYTCRATLNQPHGVFKDKRLSLLKVLESFTAILRSTIESLPRVVICWLADADKVDNFNVNFENKHGYDARRFDSPRIVAVRQSCRHGVKLSRAFLVSS